MNPHKFTLSLNLVHEPSDGNSRVHIIFVHGLRGHPYKTWLSRLSEKDGSNQLSNPDPGRSSKKQKLKEIWKRFTRKRVQSSPGLGDKNSEINIQNVFWPKDLLPRQCPRATIWSWGYDTKIAKGIGQATNKDHLYNHGMNLTREIRRLQASDQKPIIFIAHSLGGLVVKEALAYASNQEHNDPPTYLALRSTKAILLRNPTHRKQAASKQRRHA
ncbi:hypothetical protein F5B19DRAFT_117051 [Rostrohypoxylon terebratum]|nr:hypothetical protein F5B19DRAFT_117051 [Rostrohypoxylon terebratum]